MDYLVIWLGVNEYFSFFQTTKVFALNYLPGTSKFVTLIGMFISL